MKTVLKAASVAVIAALGYSASSIAGEAEYFNVDETAVDSIAGAPNNVGSYYTLLGLTAPFSANNMTLTYDSTIVQSAFNMGTATFTETGSFRVSQYTTGYIPGVTNGTDVQSALGGGLYSLHGVFSIAGTATFITADALDVNVTTGSMTFYIDTDGNGGANAFEQDAVVGSATVATGSSVITKVGNNNAANGSFEIIWTDFMLAGVGASYFPSPDPFHMILDASADIDGIVGLFDLNGTTVDTNGQGNAYFNDVPVPGSLALLGIGLLGLSRYRKTA